MPAIRVMSLAKPQRIQFCICGGRAIFLDVRYDRYFTLPARLAPEFAAVAGEHTIGTVTRDGLAALGENTKSANAECGGVEIAGTPSPAEPTGDRIADQTRAKIPVSLVAAALLIAILAKLLMRLCPLRLVLARLEAGKREGAQETDLSEVDRIAEAFRRTNLFLKSDGNCLPRTLAYVWLCRKFGHNPQFIIGVRINPFSAHCWAQDGAIVLNDALDRVRSYQPILVI